MSQGNLRSLVSAAVALRRREDWGQKAVECNLAILDLDPDNVGALCRLGFCYRRAGDFPAMRAAFEHALALETNADTRSLIEKQYFEASRLDQERRAELRERARRKREIEKQTDVSALFAMGKELRESGEHDLAAVAFFQLIDVSGSTSVRTSALAFFGSTLRDLGRFLLAMRACQQSLMLDSDPSTNGPSYACLIGALSDLHRNKIGNGIVAQVAPRAPWNEYIRNASLRCLAEGGMTSDAFAEFRRLAEQPPEGKERLHALIRELDSQGSRLSFPDYLRQVREELARDWAWAMGD